MTEINKKITSYQRHQKKSEDEKANYSSNKSEHEKDDGVRVEKKIADLMQIPKEKVTQLITEGKVKINNVVVNDLSLKVTFKDEIHINNRLIPNKRIPLKVYVFNKPKGYMVTNSDPQGRQTIFDIIPAKFGKLITVGRLDFNSEGLMLLTNNGDFARMMEMPTTGVQRQYRVRVFGDYDIKKLQSLKDGIEIKGVKYGSIFVEEEKKDGKEDSANKWLKVSLYEGKNREIRNVMEHFGLQVNRLVRTNYGKYTLGTLLTGCIVEVKPIANPGGRAREREHTGEYKKPKSKFGNIGKKPFKSFKPREVESKDDSDKPVRRFYKNDGDKKPFQSRDGDKSRTYKPRDESSRDGDFKPRKSFDGDKKPFQSRDGDKPRTYKPRDESSRDGDFKPRKSFDGAKKSFGNNKSSGGFKAGYKKPKSE